jgi:hypothetical protein
MAAAGVDYMRTGYAILSLSRCSRRSSSIELLSVCLPARCVFRGRMPATERLVGLYRRARHLPGRTVPVDVQHGLFLGGLVTSDALTGSHGLLNHIYQHHGPGEGVRFLSRIQRLTTCVSLYAYNPSVGLDDCLLSSELHPSRGDSRGSPPLCSQRHHGSGCGTTQSGPGQRPHQDTGDGRRSAVNNTPALSHRRGGVRGRRGGSPRATPRPVGDVRHAERTGPETHQLPGVVVGGQRRAGQPDRPVRHARDGLALLIV